MTGSSLIALDYGRRRVGLAGCSGDVAIAFGLTTLTILDLPDLVGQLKPILMERAVKEVIIGFPLSLADQPGPICGEIFILMDQLQALGLSVLLVDEALSTRCAETLLRERGRRPVKANRDRTSAALLLQEYLDGRLPPFNSEEVEILRRKIKPKGAQATCPS